MSFELESDKPVLPEIEQLRGKIREREFDWLRAVLNLNADAFSKHKAYHGCCNFELEEGTAPHREVARHMKPHKLEACRDGSFARIRYDRKLKVTLGLWSCHGYKKVDKKVSVATFATSTR